MEEKPRQWGIDLARMISTYGIVLIHSGDYAPYDRLALQIKDLFGFSLPFFLAASFYLLANPQKKSKLSNSISSRCNRLLIPYFAWSFVYIAARVIKDLVTHKVVDLGTLCRDPFAVLFFGAAAVHLYFLPLLFTGNLFGIIISKYKTNFKTSIALFFTSLAIYDFILQFSVNLSTKSVKFHEVFYSLQISEIQPILKLILIQAWFIIICLPYIFFARIIYTCPDEYSRREQMSKRDYLLLITIFIITITLGHSLLPSFLNEPIFGCLLLLIAINFPSSLLSDSFKKILLDLSKASFGIYLIHHLIINFSETLVLKIHPSFMSQITVLSEVLFATSGFLISWLIVRVFTNRKANYS